MAEKEKESCGDLRDIHICAVENGFKICCCYEPGDKTLSEKAGWVPCRAPECKDYVEKTTDAVVKRVKELLSHCG